jgi:hypothetical protein
MKRHERSVRGLAEVASSVVHDCNNGVAVITSSIELIDSRELSPLHSEALRRARIGADGVAAALAPLANFALFTDTRCEPLDLARELPALGAELAHGGAPVEIEPCAYPLYIDTDRTLLCAALGALIPPLGGVRIAAKPSKSGRKVALSLRAQGAAQTLAPCTGPALVFAQCFADITGAQLAHRTGRHSGLIARLTFARLDVQA